MGRPTVFALSLALALAHAAGPALAQEGAEEQDPRTDPSTLVFETWTAVGSADVVTEAGWSDSEFMYMTGVLGLVRFAPFEVGLTLDVGSSDDATHVLFGPVLGLGIDLLTGLRAEGLVQIGGHAIDGIGWAWDDEMIGDQSKWLVQGGLRIGLSARIGRDTPRVVLGGWVAVFRDLTSDSTTLEYPDGGGTETWEVGGAMGLLAVRFGFEW